MFQVKNPSIPQQHQYVEMQQTSAPADGADTIVPGQLPMQTGPWKRAKAKSCSELWTKEFGIFQTARLAVPQGWNMFPDLIWMDTLSNHKEKKNLPQEQVIYVSAIACKKMSGKDPK